MKGYFYLDTNVYRHLVEHNPAADQVFLRRHKSRLRLAATVALELLEDLATCSTNQFTVARDVITLARDAGGQVILPINDEFLARHLFHTDYRRPNLGADQIRLWIEVGVRYPSKDRLGTLIRVGAVRVPMALDVDMIRRSQQQFREEYIATMTDIRRDMVREMGVKSPPAHGGPLSGPNAKDTTTFFEGDLWKRHYVKVWGKKLGASDLTDEYLDQLWPSMRPAGEFRGKVLMQTFRDNYNFEKNANDIKDEALLDYLCDESMTLVTHDQKLRSKLSSQSQSRLVTFDQFRTRVRA